MDHNVVEFLEVIDIPISVHWLILSKVVFDKVQLQVTKKDMMRNHLLTYTYIMLSFDRNTLPDNNGVTEFA